MISVMSPGSIGDSGILASTLKSASVIGYDGGWTNIDIHHCEHVTDASSAPSSVRRLIPKAVRNIGVPVMVNGSSAPDTATKPVPRAGNQRISTEQTVTNGPAKGGHNDFRTEEQQFWECIEE